MDQLAVDGGEDLLLAFTEAGIRLGGLRNSHDRLRRVDFPDGVAEMSRKGARSQAQDVLQLSDSLLPRRGLAGEPL
jgi:hypothetical protein